MLESREEPKVGFLSIILLLVAVLLLGAHYWTSEGPEEDSAVGGFISLLSGKE